MPAISRRHAFGDSADRSCGQALRRAQDGAQPRAVGGAQDASIDGPRGRAPPQSFAPLLQAVHRHLEALLAERLDGASLQTVLLQLIEADQARKRKAGPMAFLPLFTAQLVGGAAEVAIPAAAAWNLLHLAACLFDQLEDAHPLRPASCYSPEQTLSGLDPASALNAATALLFLAPLALHTHPQSSGADQRRSFTRHGTLQLVDGLHNTWLRMCTGQHRDLTEMANPRFTLDDYWQVVGAKSGSCFAWAGQAGAVLGGGAAPQVAACARYGYNLGVLLQLADDWVDLGPGQEAGDLAQGKRTLPVLYALSVAAPAQRKRLAMLLNEAPRSPQAQAEAWQVILALGGLHYVLVQAQIYRRRAQTAVWPDAEPTAREYLTVLLDSVFPLPS